MHHPNVQRVHLSHFLDHTSSPCLETFPTSLVEPCTYWSHVEKASFFKSLARHSRWKPDLIVEDIGSGKTIADVCSYIALLDQGSARESQKGCKRDAYPIAHEVSEEWIAMENVAADELCRKETAWQGAALKDKRAQQLKEVKKSLRRELEGARGSGSEGGNKSGNVLTTSQDAKRKRHAPNEDNETWKETYKLRKRELGDSWKREDMLLSLDGRYLNTMDNMVRTLESMETDKGMEEGQQKLENIDRDRRAQIQVSASSKSPHDVLPSPIPLPEIPPDLSPVLRRRLRKRLWTRRKRAMENGLPVSEVPMDMGKLKRGRKARPKYSCAAVETSMNDSGSQVDVNLPGATEALSHPPTSQSPLHLGVWDEDEDKKDGDEELESAYKRKPYGWSKLMARQVSASTLCADGMDLFHLEKFVNIMSLLGNVHALYNEADSVAKLGDGVGPSALSYPLLRLFRACVVRFVTCLVAYVILHKDVETRQKRRIRGIFRTGGADEIRATNVREALLHMEKDTTTKQFFAKLKRTIRKAAATQAPSEKETELDPRDTDDSDESDDGSSTGETEDNTSSMGSLSVQFNPLFQTGFLHGPQSASPLFWNPSILSAFDGKEGDALLPDQIDEVGLWKELRAEEEVEDADREAAHIHERELWMEVGVTRVGPHDPVTNVGSQQTNIILQKPEGTEALQHFNTQKRSLRFRQPGGNVKSKVYINSDDDL